MAIISYRVVCVDKVCPALSGVNDEAYFCMVMYVPFHIRSLQFQGDTDYGLFAIAFMIEFCIGNNPEC